MNTLAKAPAPRNLRGSRSLSASVGRDKSVVIWLVCCSPHTAATTAAASVVSSYLTVIVANATGRLVSILGGREMVSAADAGEAAVLASEQEGTMGKGFASILAEDRVYPCLPDMTAESADELIVHEALVGDLVHNKLRVEPFEAGEPAGELACELPGELVGEHPFATVIRDGGQAPSAVGVLS